MEIQVDSADADLAPDALLSVKLGGVRRQTPLSKAMHCPLSFPDAGGGRPQGVKFELMTQVGAAWLMLRPGEEHYKVPFLGCAGAKSIRIRVGSSKGKEQTPPSTRPCTADDNSFNLDGLTETPPGRADLEGGLGRGKSAKHRNKAQSAKDYLEHHQVITFIQAVLHAMLQERPADPFAFMASQLPQRTTEQLDADCKVEVQEHKAKLDRELDTGAVRSGSHKAAPGPMVGRSRVSAGRSKKDSLHSPRGDLLNRSASSPLSKRRPTLLTEQIESFGRTVKDSFFEQSSLLEEGLEREDNMVTPKGELVPPPPSPPNVRRRSSCLEDVAPGGDKFWQRLRGETNAADEYRVLRQSVFTGRWALYSAGGKAKKPHQYTHGRRTPHLREVPEKECRCPFCPGNEQKTPPPLLFFDKDGRMHESGELTEGWRCRVIPNIFPLLVTPAGLYGEAFEKKLALIPHSSAARGEHANEALFARPLDPVNKEDIEATAHRQVHAVGYSEVIIENSLHNGLLAIVDAQQVTMALLALQHRGRTLAARPEVRQLLYFKQYGANSGGSLIHPHMQIITLPLLTPETQNRLHRAVDFHHRFGKCSVCHCLLDEPLREDGHACSRLVHETENFLLVVPFSSNQYRVTIVPREHHHSWLVLSKERVEELGELLQLVMEALFYLLDDPEYNVYLHSIDRQEEVLDANAVHWVLEVHPRFPAELGGLELASGIRVISSLPEDWAQRLRTDIQQRLQERRRGAE